MFNLMVMFTFMVSLVSAASSFVSGDITNLSFVVSTMLVVAATELVLWAINN